MPRQQQPPFMLTQQTVYAEEIHHDSLNLLRSRISALTKINSSQEPEANVLSGGFLGKVSRMILQCQDLLSGVRDSTLEIQSSRKIFCLTQKDLEQVAQSRAQEMHIKINEIEEEMNGVMRQCGEREGRLSLECGRLKIESQKLKEGLAGLSVRMKHVQDLLGVGLSCCDHVM